MLQMLYRADFYPIATLNVFNLTILFARCCLGATAATSFSWESVPRQAPSWRFLASSAVDRTQQRWFVYGGDSQPLYSCDDELWVFNSIEETWALLSSDSLEGPGPVLGVRH
jgi:hypothetical protein